MLDTLEEYLRNVFWNDSQLIVYNACFGFIIMGDAGGVLTMYLVVSCTKLSKFERCFMIKIRPEMFLGRGLWDKSPGRACRTQSYVYLHSLFSRSQM